MRSFLVLAVLCAGSSAAQNPHTFWSDSLEAYWGRIEAEYRDTAHSPLPPEYRAGFTALERFSPDTTYRVQARFKPKQGKTFGMRTTTARLPSYRSVGELLFTLQGKKYRLTVYRNEELSTRPEYANYLFVPFTDLTNGESTYGGGRYIDLQGPLAPIVELDFNRAYNPYCAYGGRYSCPIPPPENHLPVRIEAGVRKFEH